MAFGGSIYPAAMALLDDGTLRVRGEQQYGLLGDGVVESSSANWVVPIGPADIAGIAMTEKSCAAITSTGTLWTWGCNECGQAADGTIIPQYLSAPVAPPW
jgi:alpha-tubulin suppressor-like RCC1 family protein